jgi:hypothetical protein
VVQAGWGRALTTSKANRMTPQLHTSALRPSYFSPCGQRAQLGLQGVGRWSCRGQGEGLEARGAVGWVLQWWQDGEAPATAGTPVVTYPDHLWAGIVGRPEGKGSRSGNRNRTRPRQGHCPEGSPHESRPVRAILRGLQTKAGPAQGSSEALGPGPAPQPTPPCMLLWGTEV